jgi:hypothetical protein
VRTDDIHTALVQADEELGCAEPMSRGELRWLISIPEDGSLPMDGVAPVLIQWHSVNHPAMSVQDQGCRLVALELLHPQAERVSKLLRSLALSGPSIEVRVVEASAPALLAHIDTPHGRRTIGAPNTSIEGTSLHRLAAPHVER